MVTRLVVEELSCGPVARMKAEIVERKGLGHPDTICDAIMEEISRALCREYLEVFGRILHYNTDKALLVAGRTAPRPGGGKVLEPMRFVYGDRATAEYGGRRIDVAAVAEAAARRWLRDNLRHVDDRRHILFQNELHCGSAELAGIFERETLCANDTSAAVGYAPPTETERLVVATERLLNSAAFKRLFPEVGEDVKVMAYRRGRELLLTLAVAFVDRHVESVKTYFARKDEVRQAVEEHLAGLEHSLERIEVQINTLDDPTRGENGIYLTVLGTSAEGGDCGQVGRGNRADGVISLQRPMSGEAVAGKNPVSHVGKIYTLLAHQIAARIHARVAGLREVNIWLGSQIGHPLAEPAFAAARLAVEEGVGLAEIEPQVRLVLEEELTGLDNFCRRLVAGELPVC